MLAWGEMKLASLQLGPPGIGPETILLRAPQFNTAPFPPFKISIKGLLNIVLVFSHRHYLQKHGDCVQLQLCSSGTHTLKVRGIKKKTYLSK